MMTCAHCGGREEQFIRRGFIAWCCTQCHRTAIRITHGNVWRRFRAEFIDVPESRPI